MEWTQSPGTNLAGCGNSLPQQDAAIGNPENSWHFRVWPKWKKATDRMRLAFGTGTRLFFTEQARLPSVAMNVDHGHVLGQGLTKTAVILSIAGIKIAVHALGGIEPGLPAGVRR